MRPRNHRPCGMQRALSECRQEMPEWGPHFLFLFGDAASECSTLQEATDPVSI